MSELLDPQVSLEGKSSSAWRKWGTVFGRVLLGLLIVVLAIEVHAKFGYERSLAALRGKSAKVAGEPIAGEESEHEEWTLPLAEAEKCLSGFPVKHRRFQLQTPIVVLKWFSLFKTYVIQLRLDDEDIVVSLNTDDIDLSQFPDRPQRTDEFLDAIGLDVPLHPGLPSGEPPTVQLDYAFQGEWGRGAGMVVNLTRELYRQALLIAARDELGLATRDKNLGEKMSRVRRPKSFPINLLLQPRLDGTGLEVELHDWQDSSVQVLDKFNVEFDQTASLETVVAEAERLSRTKFVEFLKKQKYAGQRNPVRPEGTVPDEVPTLLSTKTYPGVVAALRTLHGLLRRDGESPERLSELAFGYALLGELNMFGNSPAQEVCQARALLYAERMSNQFPDHPLSLWGRARIRGMIGRHRTAKEDLVAATQRNQQRGANALEIPSWVPLIERFVSGDHEVVTEYATQSLSDAAMLELLELEIATAQADDPRKLSALKRLPWLHPEVGRMSDKSTLAAIANLGEDQTARQLRDSSKRFCDQLQSLPNLPDSLRRLCGESSSQGVPLEFRKRMTAELDQFSLPAKDSEEPSLAVVGGYLREWNLLESLGLVVGIGDAKSMDPLIDQLLPLVQGHPFEGYLEGMSRDPQRLFKAHSQLREANLWVWINKNSWMPLTYLHASGHVGSTYQNHIRQLYGTTAPIFADLLWSYRTSPTFAEQQSAARQLIEQCPDSPYSVAAMIQRDWPAVKQRAAEWEAKYANSVDVQTQLGVAYRSSLQYDAAARCLNRAVQAEGSPFAYEQTALLALNQDDFVAWKSARDTQIRLMATSRDDYYYYYALADAAKDMLKLDRPKEALSYAEKAASPPAEWTLAILAQCHEALGDWNAAHKTREQMARVEDGWRSNWYFWCQRTGRGDLAAAHQWMSEEGWLQKLLANPHEDSRRWAGLYAFVTDDLETAGKHFTSGSDDEIYGLNWDPKTSRLPPPNKLLIHQKGSLTHVARLLWLDQLGKLDDPHKITEEVVRGCFHAHAVKIPDGPITLRDELRKYFSTPAPRKIDLRRLHWILLGDDSSGLRTETLWFIGRLLLNEGRQAEALPYLRLAATSPITQNAAAVMAGYTLRKLGETIGPMRGTELDQPEARLVRWLDTARYWLENEDFERAHLVCEKIDQLKPNWAPALALRGKTCVAQQDFAGAVKLFSQAITEAPEIPELFWRRGKANLELTKYAQALEDFQHTLELEPLSDEGHWGVAMIRSAAPLDELRDGKDAVKHAEAIDLLHCLYEPWLYKALSATYGEFGDFPKAIQLKGLEAFRHKTPYRLPTPKSESKE